MITEVFILSNYLVILTLSIYLLVLIHKFITSKNYQYISKISVYFIAITLMLTLNTLNIRNAEIKANSLIQAIKAYKIKNHRYPHTLKDLIPEFLDKIPPAKYSLFQNRFIYYCDPNNTSFCLLSYTVAPPYYRKVYSFKNQKWSIRD